MAAAKTTQGALNGVKVVDLSLLYPGPLCSQFMADMGAEVIKVENPRAADLSRYLGKKLATNGVSNYFAQWNRNKKSLTLNLKREEAKAILKKILTETDVLIEGFRPSAMKKLGLDYETLKSEFPRLIFCSISGYGKDGPFSDQAGHDANYIALAGVLGLNGKAEAPMIPGFQLADAAGSYVALASITAALYQREKTGQGQQIDVAMADSALSFMSLYFADYAASLSPQDLPLRGQLNLSGQLPNYRVYKIADGSFVVLAALEKIFFSAFLNQIGRGDLLDLINFHSYNMQDQDSGKIQKCHQELENFFAQQTSKQLQIVFENPNCCLSKIKNVEEIFGEEYFYQRNMIFSAVSPEGCSYRLINSPFRMSNSPLNYRSFAPALGQHNSEILSALGYSSEDIANMRSKNIL